MYSACLIHHVIQLSTKITQPELPIYLMNLEINVTHARQPQLMENMTLFYPISFFYSAFIINWNCSWKLKRVGLCWNIGNIENVIWNGSNLLPKSVFQLSCAFVERNFCRRKSLFQGMVISTQGEPSTPTLLYLIMKNSLQQISLSSLKINSLKLYPPVHGERNGKLQWKKQYFFPLKLISSNDL